jgi:hypothetical protein
VGTGGDGGGPCAVIGRATADACGLMWIYRGSARGRRRDTRRRVSAVAEAIVRDAVRCGVAMDDGWVAGQRCCITVRCAPRHAHAILGSSRGAGVRVCLASSGDSAGGCRARRADRTRRADRAPAIALPPAVLYRVAVSAIFFGHAAPRNALSRAAVASRRNGLPAKRPSTESDDGNATAGHSLLYGTGTGARPGVLAPLACPLFRRFSAGLGRLHVGAAIPRSLLRRRHGRPPNPNPWIK